MRAHQAELRSEVPHVCAAVKLAFLADGSITSLDGQSLNLNYSAPHAGDAGGTDLFLWHVIMPPATTTTLPELSTDLVPTLPTQASLHFGGFVIQKGTPFNSYKSYRHNWATYVSQDALTPSPYHLVTTGVQAP